MRIRPWKTIFLLAILLTGGCAAPTPTEPPTATQVPPSQTPLPSTASPIKPTSTPTRPNTVTPRPATSTRLPPTPSPTPPFFQRNLYLTDPPLSGEDVLALQERLLQLGYDQVGEPDGAFGPATLRAVKAFQWDAYLFVDGIVGPYTWQTLFDPELKLKRGRVANDYGLTDTIICAYDHLWMSWMMSLAVANTNTANPAATAKIFEAEDVLLVNGPWAALGMVWTQETIGSFYDPDTADFLVARDPQSHEIVKTWRLLDLLYWEPTVLAMVEVNGNLWVTDQQGMVYVISPSELPQVIAEYFLDGEVRSMVKVGRQVWANAQNRIYLLSAEDGSVQRQIDRGYDYLSYYNNALYAYSWKDGGLAKIDPESGEQVALTPFEINGSGGCYNGMHYWWIDFYDGAIKRQSIAP